MLQVSWNGCKSRDGLRWKNSTYVCKDPTEDDGEEDGESDSDLTELSGNDSSKRGNHNRSKDGNVDASKDGSDDSDNDESDIDLPDIAPYGPKLQALLVLHKTSLRHTLLTKLVDRCSASEKHITKQAYDCNGQTGSAVVA